MYVHRSSGNFAIPLTYPHMKAIVTFLMLAALVTVVAHGQTSTALLTFTAENNGVYVRLDSVKVQNRTQGGFVMLHRPDTTILLNYTPGDLFLYVGYITEFPVGIGNTTGNSQPFRFWQNASGQETGKSTVTLFIPRSGTVSISATDMQGRTVAAFSRNSGPGTHSFLFIPGADGFYLLTASWNGEQRVVKTVAAGLASTGRSALEEIPAQPGISMPPGTSAPYEAHVEDSGILDHPDGNETHRFQFARNIPCIGLPIVGYEWRYYPTIQVYSQCWLKDNLNVGIMVDSLMAQTDNGYFEKYCIGNNLDSCEKYGGLYEWFELMQYSTQEGARGICPPGWHIPSDEEGKVLDGAMDTRYGIGDSIWDQDWYRGSDAGTCMMSTNYWFSSPGTDRLGYRAYPGGRRVQNSNYCFYYSQGSTFWWTSTINSTACGAWMRYLSYEEAGIGRGTTCDGFESGMMARCIKDY